MAATLPSSPPREAPNPRLLYRKEPSRAACRAERAEASRCPWSWGRHYLILQGALYQSRSEMAWVPRSQQLAVLGHPRNVQEDEIHSHCRPPRQMWV